MAVLTKAGSADALAEAAELHWARHFAVSTLGSIPLPDDVAAVDLTQPIWVHAANEGEYRGYQMGPVLLTRADFEAMVRNLRSDPKFPKKRGVVQYDYEHASEMDPSSGSIPSKGAPAIGWVLDLEIRDGADGRAQLWALSKFGDQAQRQISLEEYASVSIAWATEALHWVTGEPIGAVLTSIALTNHPFLRDLELIAASNRVAWLRARSGALGAGAVNQEPQRTVAEAHAGGQRSTNDGGGPTMAADAYHTTMCRIFALNPAAAGEDDVTEKAEETVKAASSLGDILTALGVSDAAAATAAIPELVAAREQLVGLLAELDALMQADAAADAAIAEADVASAIAARGWRPDSQMTAAVKAHRAAMVTEEISKLDGKAGAAARRSARAKGREAFLSAYAVDTNPQTRQLTQTFVAGPGAAAGQTRQIAAAGAAPAAPLLPPTGQPLPGTGGPPAVDLSQYSGRNDTERAIAYLGEHDPSFKKLSWGAQVTRATSWRRDQAAALS